MSVYSPIRIFLEARNAEQIPMTFAEIENIIGRPLPASKQYPAWWSNNPSNNPMTREWLDAGFQTESVNTASGKLVFRRVMKLTREAVSGTAAAIPESAGSPGKRTSIFGCMKGTLTLLPGVDLTAPADPDLADYIDRKYGAEEFT